MVRTLRIKTDGADLIRKNEALRAENRTLRQIISEFKGMSDKRTVGALGETLTAGRFGLKLVSGNKGWDLTTRDGFKVELKYSSYRQVSTTHRWRFHNVWCKDHCDAVLFMGQVPPLMDIVLASQASSPYPYDDGFIAGEVKRMEQFVHCDSFYSLVPWSVLQVSRQTISDISKIPVTDMRKHGRYAIDSTVKHAFGRSLLGKFWDSSYSLRGDWSIVLTTPVLLMSLFAVSHDYIRKGGLDSLLSSIDLHTRASNFQKSQKKP